MYRPKDALIYFSHTCMCCCFHVLSPLHTYFISTYYHCCCCNSIRTILHFANIDRIIYPNHLNINNIISTCTYTRVCNSMHYCYSTLHQQAILTAYVFHLITKYHEPCVTPHPKGNLVLYYYINYWPFMDYASFTFLREQCYTTVVATAVVAVLQHCPTTRNPSKRNRNVRASQKLQTSVDAVQTSSSIGRGV